MVMVKPTPWVSLRAIGLAPLLPIAWQLSSLRSSGDTHTHTHTHTSHIWLYYQNFFGQRFRTAAFVWANLLTRILISRRPPWSKGVKHSWSATKGCWLLKIDGDEIYLFGLPTTPNPLLKVSDQAIARQHCWEEILLGGWLGTLKYTNYS